MNLDMLSANLSSSAPDTIARSFAKNSLCCLDRLGRHMDCAEKIQEQAHAVGMVLCQRGEIFVSLCIFPLRGAAFSGAVSRSVPISFRYFVIIMFITSENSRSLLLKNTQLAQHNARFVGYVPHGHVA
jgi:hypothetical protein